MRITALVPLVCLFIAFNSSYAIDKQQVVLLQQQELKQVDNLLSDRQQAIIPIAAFAATGDMVQLTTSLHQGLDRGLSINEIKALLVQTYAYAGFPRSLNALGAFMQVLQQRKANAITDIHGKHSEPLPEDYHAIVQGTHNQTALVGMPVTGALFEFAPEIDEYLKAHLFGDIFSRDVLSWQDREIATLGMLAAMHGTEGQLKSHILIAQRQGVNDAKLKQITTILTDKVSPQVGLRFEQVFASTSP